jgi:chemotaxis family two-component system response regulator Rcp1
MNDNRPIEILMAEDSPTDQAIVQRAFKSSKLHNHLHIVWNGEEALEFLRREGKFASAPVPDLILLDMNMPRKDGRETLAEIKQHDQWKLIPVVILTSSKAERDIITAYGLHANCYVVKPVDFEQIIQVVHCIESFWFTVVKLPHTNGGHAHG